MTIPDKWLNFIKRVVCLAPGDWVIVLKIRKGEVPTFQVGELDKPEH